MEVASQSASGSVSATATTLVFGAIDFNSSAAAEEEVKNIAAAQHSGIKLDEVRFYNAALIRKRSHAASTTFGKGDLRKVGGFLHRSLSYHLVCQVLTFSTTITADFPNPLYYAI